MSKKPSMVYVIDDDESVGKAFARLLQSAGLDAETFSSAIREEKPIDTFNGSC